MEHAATWRARLARRGAHPAWLAAGVAVGLVLAPAAAVAAGVSVSQLVGTNGIRAQVSRAGQLVTAPADPSLYRAFDSDGVIGGSGCTKVFTAPPGWSFVVTDLEVDTYVDPSPGQGQDLAIDVDENHSLCYDTLLDVNPSGVGLTSVPLTPGFVVPSGHSLAAVASGDVSAEVYGQGYLVHSSAAPHETPLTTAAQLRGAG